jgi:hypothetical protein
MARYDSSGSYQGVPITGCSVDRKPGLSSDSSWVEILTDDLGKIELDTQFRPWADIKRKEIAGPASVYGILKAMSGAGATAGGGSASQAKNGVLQRGGALILESKSSAGAPVDKSDIGGLIKLDPMFVSPSGIREAQEDLARAEEHREGRTIIGLVDIRYWWAKYGTPMFGDYNIVNEYGFYDEAYLNKETKKPLPLSDLLRALCFCLPGAPILSTASIVFTQKFNPPKNIRMRFDLPYVWLYRLLEDYGLDIHLTHESNVYIARRADSHTVGMFSQVPGGSEKRIFQAANHEKKTVYAVEKPEGVFVAGGKRQRRGSFQCAPAYVDEDGQPRLMEDLAVAWGGDYTYAKARRSRFLPGTRAFTDVPGKDSRQIARRRQIADQYFFRFYLPRIMFPTTDKKGSLFANLGKTKHPMTPMLSPVWRQQELDNICGASPTNAAVIAGEELVKTAIIVRASLIKEDFTDNLKGFTKKVQDALQSIDDRVSALAARRTQINKILKELEDGRPKFQMNKVQELLGQDEFQAQAYREFLSTSFLGGLLLLDRDQLQKDANWNAQAGVVKDRATVDLKSIEDKIGKLKAEEKEIKKGLTEAIEAIKKHQLAKMWVNLPYGCVSNDSFNVDPATGAISFNCIAGKMDVPAIRDLENAFLLGDGDVEVTYNYELNNNRPNDYSYWAFLGSSDGGQPTLVEICEPTGIKAAIVKDEELVIYQDEIGEPMNLPEVTQKAARAAGSAMRLQKQQDGYEYQYPGFWEIATDFDQNEVIWAFDGDEATTTIFANHPDGSADGWNSLTKKRDRESVVYKAWLDIQ